MAEQKSSKTKKVPGLRVTAKVANFRRAGRAWGAIPEEIAVSELSKEQIKALQAEPMLTVEEIELSDSAE